ncbi:MAG: hypothetical protein DRQ24_10105, partial [Candidatus Latescibacterota bacterium]
NILLTQDNNDVVNLSAASTISGNIEYKDRSAVNLLAVHTADGKITITASGQVTATDVDSSATDNGKNDILLTSTGGDIQAIWINAGDNNNVVLNAPEGSITQDGIPARDIISNILEAFAEKGINLDTQIHTLSAENIVSGDIVIDNVGDLYASQVTNQGGNIYITTHSDLIVGNIQAAGDSDVYLVAADGNILDDLTNDPDDTNYIGGDLVDLTATGNIGQWDIPNGDIDIAANTINASAGGDLILEERDGAFFNNLFAGGRLRLSAHGPIYLGYITTDGLIDIRISSGDITIKGWIKSNHSGIKLTTDTGSIYAEGGGPHFIANDDSFLNAPQGKISPIGAPLTVMVVGDLYLDIANLSITSPTRETYGILQGNITPLGTPLIMPNKFPQPLNPPGFIYFNKKQIWPPKSNADYQYLSQLIVKRNSGFIFQYRQDFYNNPRSWQEVAKINTGYFAESLQKSRFASFEPVTPLLYAYHPLTAIDSSAIEGIGLDIGAYEFIDNTIKKKKEPDLKTTN